MSQGHNVIFCNPFGAPETIIKEAGVENVAPDLHHFPTKLAPATTEVWTVDLPGYALQAPTNSTHPYKHDLSQMR